MYSIPNFQEEPTNQLRRCCRAVGVLKEASALFSVERRVSPRSSIHARLPFRRVHLPADPETQSHKQPFSDVLATSIALTGWLLACQVTWVEPALLGGQPLWKGPLKPDQQAPVITVAARPFDLQVSACSSGIPSLQRAFSQFILAAFLRLQSTTHLVHNECLSYYICVEVLRSSQLGLTVQHLCHRCDLP